MSEFKNVDLGKTQITDKVRVSSAAIFYDEWFGKRYQLETFIFSEDKSIQQTRQIIHCSTGTVIPQSKIDEVKKIHSYISNNLKQSLPPTP